MSNNEYCEACGHDHGPLYVCEHYSEEKKAEKRAASERFQANLRDPRWVREQTKRGVPLMAVQIMGMFVGAGVAEPGEES